MACPTRTDQTMSWRRCLDLLLASLAALLLAGYPPGLVGAVSSSTYDTSIEVYDGILHGAAAGGASARGQQFNLDPCAAADTAVFDSAIAVADAANPADEVVGVASNVPKITFGHGARHLEGTGLGVEEVESTILQRVTTAASQATSETGSFWGRIEIRGTTIEYRAYTLPDGTINVGTFYVP